MGACCDPFLSGALGLRVGGYEVFAVAYGGVGFGSQGDDSPGLSHVLVGGACSRIRLLTTLGPGAVVAFVCDAFIALVVVFVL